MLIYMIATTDNAIIIIILLTLVQYVLHDSNLHFHKMWICEMIPCTSTLSLFFIN